MSSEQSTQPQASDRARNMPKGEMRSAGNAGMPKGEMRSNRRPATAGLGMPKGEMRSDVRSGMPTGEMRPKGKAGTPGEIPHLPGTQGPGATRPYANDTLATNASSSPGGGTLREYAQSTATSGADPIGASVRVARPTEARTSHGTARGKARSNTP